MPGVVPAHALKKTPTTNPAHALKDQRDLWPVAVLGGLIAIYIVVFGTLTWKEQSNYGTFGFDMGIYDQGIWLVSRFKEPFVTIRGLNYFGHHVNLITVLFVPAYWLGAGPHFLYLVETVFLAAGAIPVWLLARDHVGDRIALVPAAAYLLYPSIQWVNWWHFHPDALITAPLLFAWWLASRKKWGWYLVAVAAAMLAKEDAALAIAAMGVVLWIRGERRWGWRTAAIGAGYYLIATKLIIPIANGGTQPFYEGFYGEFGDSIPEILWNIVRHPNWVWDVGTMPDRMTYYRLMFSPVAFLPFASPLLLLIGLPQMLANVLTGFAGAHDAHAHYTSVITAVVFIAVTDVFAKAARRGLAVTAIVCVALLGGATWMNRVDSPSPFGRAYGVWRTHAPADHLPLDRAIALIEPDDKVSASFFITPHLTHRRYIYEYPNPFRQENWGVNGERPPGEETCDTLLLDTRFLGGNADLYEKLVAPDGPFRIVFHEGDIVIARRK